MKVLSLTRELLVVSSVAAVSFCAAVSAAPPLPNHNVQDNRAVFITSTPCPNNRATDENPQTTAKRELAAPAWLGKYPMSFFTKTRSAKTVGKGHLSISLKIQHFDWDMVRGSDDEYHSRVSADTKRKLTTVLCTKYGWAEDHHLALGIPYFFNDFDIGGKTNKSEGLGNIFLFEKWNFIRETRNFPAVAADFWYYLPTGDSDRKLGSDDGAYKVTAEVSKAWKDFSLHFNPGYTWSEDDDAELGEINAALLLTTTPKLWSVLEYNYLDKESSGHCHDLVPGAIWKFAKGWSFKIGIPVSVDSTFKDRDRVGFVVKIFYRF